MTYYFLQDMLAFKGPADSNILSDLHTDHILYLFEPGSSLENPKFEIFTGKIIATCSPDDKRYKEFKKKGAKIFYMPVWSLKELQLVGTYVHAKDTFWV